MASAERKISWHELTADEVAKKLGVKKTGLDEREVLKRLKKYGPNRIPSPREHSFLIILARQFKSFLVAILVFAAVLSFILGDKLDGYVVLAAIFVNVALGFWQEWQAHRAMESLKALVRWNSTAIRDGRASAISSERLVPGDIVVLRVGEKVGADLRLVKAENLQINEAILTGESLPDAKKAVRLKEKNLPIQDVVNMAFMGTLVVRGNGLGIVTATGIKTEIGQIGGLVASHKESQTPLQEKISKLSRNMGFAVISIAFAVLLFGLFKSLSFWEIFKTAVALAVSAVPEGLLIGVTVVLAFGAQDLVRKKALVRRLISAETLGSTTVICVDKTGTLTEGQPRVARIITLNNDLSFVGKTFKIGARASEEILWVLRTGVLCNDSGFVSNTISGQEIIGDPVDVALMTAGGEAGIDIDSLSQSFKRVKTIPFDEENRYMVTVHRYGERYMFLIKGAPEVILDIAENVQDGNKTAKLNGELRSKFLNEIRGLSDSGLKVLGCGYKHINSPDGETRQLGKITLLGFFGMKDLLRKDAREALSLARKARVRTVMITGDHKLTAYAIARDLGLKVSLKDIKEEKDLENIKLDEVTVFSRISPKGKLKIVDALKERGEVVAMTGDGVNDVPALKAADVGLALGSGSQAAKDVADIVLLENDFNVIVHAIEQGRKIIEHLRTIVFYLLSHSFGEILVISASMLFGMPLALLPVQILWINLANDSLPHLALAKEQYNNNMWDIPPEKRGESLLKREHIKLLAVISLLAGVSTFLVYFFIIKTMGNVDVARTMAFSILGLDALAYAFSLRDLRHTIFCSSPLKNRYLMGAVFFGVALQVAAVHLPLLQRPLNTTALDFSSWLVVLAIVAWTLSGIEFSKKVLLK